MDYVNSIIRGVSLVLKEMYPDIPVYDYYPEQDFQIPSFVIEEASTVKDRRLGLMTDKSYRGSGPRNIHYTYFHLMYNDTDWRRIRQVVENVEPALDEIMLEDGYPIHLYSVSTYINKGYSLTSFKVRYTTWVKPKEYPRMEELKLEEALNQKG